MSWHVSKTTEYATLYASEIIRDYYAKVEVFHHGHSFLWYVHRTDSSNYVKWGGGDSMEDAQERAMGWIMERIFTE